jgi:iron complex transport system permease protein
LRGLIKGKANSTYIGLVDSPHTGFSINGKLLSPSKKSINNRSVNLIITSPFLPLFYCRRYRQPFTLLIVLNANLLWQNATIDLLFITVRFTVQKISVFSLSAVLIALLIGGIVVASSSGAVDIPIPVFFRLLFHAGLTEEQALLRTILIDIRLPRIVLAITVGAGLAIAGGAMQALFRNPLAEPGLLGVSSGAALGAVTAIVLGCSGVYILSLSAFVGALVTTLIVWQLGQRFFHIAGLIMAGMAMNAITTSLTGFLTYFASDDELRSLTFWSMGSLASASWRTLSWVTPSIFLLSYVIFRHWQAFNVLLLGERESLHLGFNLAVLKRQIIFYTALIVGLVVATCGTIGFVGLVVPHLVRIILGPNHRTLLPLSFLMGATLLIFSDYIARFIAIPAELPIGIITSLIGGPFFIFLLCSRRYTG